MSFKDNLKDELNYQGILVKELSDKCKIPKGTIDHYLAEKNTEPTAENAVRIAQALHVTVEYLVTGSNNPVSQKDEETEQIKLYKKYHTLIEKCEKLPDEKIKLLVQVADNFNK